MKCPSCGIKGNWRYQFKVGDSSEKYECSSCHAVLKSKYSFVFMMASTLIGIPVITFLVDFLTVITLYSTFGHIDFFGYDLLSIISNGLVILIIIRILYIFNQYEVVSYNSKP